MTWPKKLLPMAALFFLTPTAAASPLGPGEPFPATSSVTVHRRQLPGEGREKFPCQSGEVDLSQPLLFLDLFRAISKGGSVQGAIDGVMAAPGTGLIVEQMNLARRVTRDQYRRLLKGLATGSPPPLAPADSSRRARRGVEGLRRDVWPALEWGLAHRGELEARVRHVAELDLLGSADEMANRFLPRPLSRVPQVYVVMGGRAGGASLGDGRIYLDVLVFSYLERRTGGFPSDQELVGTIAHEMHHMGYLPYLDSLSAQLGLSDGPALQFRFLSGLLGEGTATYLISEGRSLEGMKSNRLYAELLADPDALLSEMEGILEAIQTGGISTTAQYEEATADLLGSWFHSAGSLLLGAIDQAHGLAAVEEVIRDPRGLLLAYNRATRALGDAAPGRPVDSRVSRGLQAMGRA